MKRIVLFLLFVMTINLNAQQVNWQNILQNEIQLFGHRNWIMVVDAAYPYQSKPAIKTIATNSTQMEVVKEVMKAVNNADHVAGEIFLDKEIDFVPETDYPEIKAYKNELGKLFKNSKVSKVLHEEMIANIDEAAKTFNILVLKTDMVIPYTSVFIRLDCGYWNGNQEAKLRQKMGK